MDKTTLIFAGLALSFPAAIAGAAVFDATETRTIYKTDFTLSGYRAVVEQDVGRLGFRQGSRIVGYYLAGTPRLVAFGCEGRAPDAVLIAIEEDALPRCKRIEPIQA